MFGLDRITPLRHGIPLISCEYGRMLMTSMFQVVGREYVTSDDV